METKLSACLEIIKDVALAMRLNTLQAWKSLNLLASYKNILCACNALKTYSHLAWKLSNDSALAMRLHMHTHMHMHMHNATVHMHILVSLFLPLAR